MESDFDINSLALVPKEITSSTLTTRLKGICKINRLIDHANDLNPHHPNHNFHSHHHHIPPPQDSQNHLHPHTPHNQNPTLNDVQALTNYQENVNKFRDWILKNQIIEHIFGPNCHVEIIKQSHTILNFVAYSLDNEHVDVIWSASSMKHCGRQVLDLLISLVRYMRTGPVLHLYNLVKSLDIEDHSEYTLLLTSHILRFIWSHSPCVNQIQLCNLQNQTESAQMDVQDPIDNEQHLTIQANHQQQQVHLHRSPQYQLVESENDQKDKISGLSHQQQQQQQQHQQLQQQHIQTQRQASTSQAQMPGDNLKLSVVEHILKSIANDNSPPSQSSPSHQKQSSNEEANEAHNIQGNLDTGANDNEWLRQQWRVNNFLDNTSDVSACCSEEKNMGDFDDDAQVFMQDENTYSNDDASPNPSPSEMYRNAERQDSPNKSEMITGENRDEIIEISDSAFNSRESKCPMSIERSSDSIQQLSLESIAQYKELKKASSNFGSVTSHYFDDEDLKRLIDYNLGNLCEPGKTLLWDLLQDGKVEQLSVNLHLEVENVLVNLVMSFGDRYIRYRFIEACLENLSLGTSVIISLRLLPKLMSFNTIRGNLSIPAVNETHAIVLWAEQEYNMSQNFFKNLVQYYTNLDEGADSNTKGPLFSHIDKIITRMSFLTFIYSKPFSPETMKLNRDQMDQLWDCLASDNNPRCSDVLFQWIYQQAVGDDFHGVNDELLDHVLKNKLPTLNPEEFRLRGLKLLEQLLWIRQDYECCHGLEHPATRLLWDIGLKAVDDEVSMAAIRILNHFYIYTNHQKSTRCDKGVNFISHCMDQLQRTITEFVLTKGSDPRHLGQHLDVMQKIILLIRTHLEVFKAHWSYYLRILQLNNEADLISHRLNAYEIKLTMTIRLVCQAASSIDKTTIEMQAGDFVGELRAEIVKWWYSQVDRGFYEQSMNFAPSSSPGGPSTSSPKLTNIEDGNNPKSNQEKSDSLNSFTEFLLANHQSLRLLSHNQEIPFEWDERQINELDFKDMQVIYVLNDVKSSQVEPPDDVSSDKSNEVSRPNHLLKSEIPSILMQSPEYFENLIETDSFLGSFSSDDVELTNRAKTLSRRIWEIVQILPTCPYYKEDIKRCGLAGDNSRLRTSECSDLFDLDCPQRLLYSLQIVDILKSSNENPNWGSTFIGKGGLADIFEVFMSPKLLPRQGEEWNEWLQECLAYLLKLLFQFGTRAILPSANDSSSSSSMSRSSSSNSSTRVTLTGSSSLKKARRARGRILGSAEDRLSIPRFSEELLKLLEDGQLILDRLIMILKSSAFCKNRGDQYYYVTVSSRAMIVHHVMSFLASWCKSDPKFPKFHVSEHESLLKALILDDNDSSTRREACGGFFRLHHACSSKVANTSIDSINSTISSMDTTNENNSISFEILSEPTNWTFSTDLLRCLIKFLPIAESMRPPKPIRNYASENDYIRELNSPGCKDYFWLTCRLIDSPATQNLTNEQSKPSDVSMNSDGPSPADCPQASMSINLFELCEYLIIAIRERKIYETRDFTVEDDTLRGMLLMMVMALRREPHFRYTNSAFEFIHELYDYLFAPPNQSERYLPKCKSPATRSTAFDLMLALVERCPKNYFWLLELLLTDQHNSVVKGTYPNDYWPHDDCRSEVGFVGLVNLGATCYLATCMQHLFMIPNLRYAILGIDETKDIRHGEIIRELQKMFTFMLESERKAYNPRNFCKVYTMDNHPLNIAEQTDMTEFFTDLISKLEESSPELRRVIKGLFSGTLSNNVVSLDCPHISRTTEEFYTLRVQVADMRSLNDSLDELTIKDTLEGDNMYTCSTCEKKVRAEKRACIVKLPRILCFNTMRYTFNMATMTKEKVNTHFSFPLRLDMNDYLEENLMKRKQSSAAGSCNSKDTATTTSSEGSTIDDKEDANMQNEDDGQQTYNLHPDRGTSSYNSEHSGANSETDSQDLDGIYELIGVTVHTGNADGGHYYCFIRDCEDQSTDKPRWYLFNDAEVKPFDDSHIGQECYGGELTTKSYDAINDRFMDFSIEKTNSAYMLFYKRVDYKYASQSVALRYLESDTQRNNESHLAQTDDQKVSNSSSEDRAKNIGSKFSSSKSLESDFGSLCQQTYDDFRLPKHLATWVWTDNMKFARDKNVFEHNFFNFMWQVCANLPKTLNQIPEKVIERDPSSPFVIQSNDDTVAIRTVHLAITFVLGVLMNSRERPNLTNWTELIRKQFNASKAACDWLMHLIDDEETWLKQMLLRCPIEMVRQLFQRLCNDLSGSKQHKKLRLIR